jgi:hypothetical protein
MSELVLRIKGIVGSLKVLALLGLLAGILMLWAAASQLTTALKNPSGPMTVTVEQLVDGSVGKNQYVSARGYAWYEPAYTEEDDNGTIVSTYFFLSDETTGHVIVVKAKTKTLDGRISKVTDVEGITAGTPGDLYQLIAEDIAWIEEEGFTTTPALYLSEGAKPPTVGGSLTFVIVAGILLLTSLTGFLFPTVVFAARPLEVFNVPDEGNPGIKASGKFQALTQVRPTIEVGRKKQNFTRGVANIIPLGEDKLLIYIHHVVRSYVYGIKVGTQETDWGIFLDRANVTKVEPGKLYGWKTRWAVRFHYTNQKGKPQTVVISFDKPWGQTRFTDLLREMGFPTTEPHWY